MTIKILNTILFLTLLLTNLKIYAQCSICTRTAQQLGEGPAHGFNTGIIYLALTPFAIIFYIGYKWWKSNKQ